MALSMVPVTKPRVLLTDDYGPLRSAVKRLLEPGASWSTEPGRCPSGLLAAIRNAWSKE